MPRTKAVVLWAVVIYCSLSTTCLADQSIMTTSSSQGDSMLHEDSRCLCKCPDVSTIRTQREADLEEDGRLEPLPVTDGRSIYLNASVGPNQCDCDHVVLIHLNLTETQAKSFCPRCSCKFQIRSLTVMKVVVIVVIWVISILVIYMGFLQCLDPILNGNKRALGTTVRGGAASSSGMGVGYQEHRDEEDEEPSEGATPMQAMQGSDGAGPGAPGRDVINRLGNQQTKWKRQVQEQRRNIYDTHRMLN